MQVYNLHMKNIFSEITEIFRFIDFETLNKIPNDIKQEIYRNANPQHVFQYDINKTIEEQEVMEDTKDFIAIIFIRFCCNEEEKSMLLNKCLEKEKNFQNMQREKYNPDNIFNKIKQKDNNIEGTKNISNENQLLEYKESFFMRFKKFILKIFSKKI